MYFFTATINSWQKLLLDDKIKDIIINSLEWLCGNARVSVHGFVLMPNHIHLLWSSRPDYKIEDAEKDLLSFTGHEIKRYLLVNDPHMLANFISTQADRQYHFWERRASTIDIMSREIAWQKLQYIHFNPVQEKWQLGLTPEAYKYSSALFYLNDDRAYQFLTHYLDFC